MTGNGPAMAPTRVSQSEEAGAVDEPPDHRNRRSAEQNFKRTAIKPPERQDSLLTKAILQSDEDAAETNSIVMVNIHRRRSLTSNVSFASTADLTSDTGLTSPERSNTPSPPIPDVSVLRLGGSHGQTPKTTSLAGDALKLHDAGAPKDAPRKRCIQFACAAKPTPPEQLGLQAQPMRKTLSASPVPRRPCIKFACVARPESTQTIPTTRKLSTRQSTNSTNGSPSTPRKTSALLVAQNSSLRPIMPRKSPNQLTVPRPKFLRANSNELVNDASQYHEFAGGASRDDDWIRQAPLAKARLTIDDTLTKENDFRRIATEAEEEAELEEEEEDEEAIDDEDVDDLDDDDDGDENHEGHQVQVVFDENDYDYSDSDGYHTDEETGFAESESEDEADENMILWTPSRATIRRDPRVEIPAMRRSLVEELHSDSSNATESGRRTARPSTAQRVKPVTEAPYLPDSTDFVCGTLDEDRPLEEAYLTCMAARRNEKLRVIPQDIDPSFPTSGPEDDDEEEVYNPVHHGSDENVWMQGEMEDLHHDQDRSRRRRKSEHASPRKYHSPPPKRHHSPPPKRFHSPPPKPRTRGRSPQTLFDRQSPRRLRSPAPKFDMSTPTASLRNGEQAGFQLAGRPVTQTKSLPRPGALFGQLRSRNLKAVYADDIHVRGAIDIVKGLEKKRQRRREKFHQKYCNRARRGQIPERKAQPGKGAERMKELGLLMAGKKDPGNYVLSV